MSHRVVTDAAGHRWQVWAVIPGAHTGRSGVALGPHYASGWLAFERLDAPAARPVEKRRLTPVPAGWETAPERQVLGWLTVAVPVAPLTASRTTPPAGTPRALGMPPEGPS